MREFEEANLDRGKGSKRWLGRTEFLTRTIQSEPRLETRKPTLRAKWRSFPNAIGSLLENMLDTADIVVEIDMF